MDSDCSNPSTGTADAEAPFCGTAASEGSGGNIVALGVCGKCQKTAGGGGGDNACTASSDPSECVAGSCTGMICCMSGKCAANQAGCA